MMNLELEVSHIVVRAGSIPTQFEGRSFAIIGTWACSHRGANPEVAKNID
jgi:hypothetical protein